MTVEGYKTYKAFTDFLSEGEREKFFEELLKYLADIEDGTPEEDVLYLIHTFEEVYQSCREDPKCSLRSRLRVLHKSAS